MFNLGNMLEEALQKIQKLSVTLRYTLGNERLVKHLHHFNLVCLLKRRAPAIGIADASLCLGKM